MYIELIDYEIFLGILCFNRINDRLEQLERAYLTFERILQRFDCMLAVDSGSATRPFSPNGTCQDCKVNFIF